MSKKTGLNVEEIVKTLSWQYANLTNLHWIKETVLANAAQLAIFVCETDDELQVSEEL